MVAFGFHAGMTVSQTVQEAVTFAEKVVRGDHERTELCTTRVRLEAGVKQSEKVVERNEQTVQHLLEIEKMKASSDDRGNGPDASKELVRIAKQVRAHIFIYIYIYIYIYMCACVCVYVYVYAFF